MTTFVFLLAMASGLTVGLLHVHAKTTPAPVKKVEPAPVKTPAATTTAKPKPKTATTNAAVFLRAGKGTNSSIVAGLDEGETVTLGSDSDANWQEVTSAKGHGYVSKPYLNFK
jgi:uncharacterized protein YgiM (DUF1202 family)